MIMNTLGKYDPKLFMIMGAPTPRRLDGMA